MKKNIIFLLSILSSQVFSTEIVDTLFEKQWGVKNSGQVVLRSNSKDRRDRLQSRPGTDINWISLANKNIPKDREVIVAVLDTGIDQSHPDLEGRLWFNEKVCSSLTEAEKKVRPCHGWNFVRNNSRINDDVGHGTHIAGVIAANHNQIGIAGITHPQVKIMPLKVLDRRVGSYVVNSKLITDIYADAIGFAIENGADVISISIGWIDLVNTEKIQKAIQAAIEKDIAVVVAAGNNNKEIAVFPCSYEGVICVGAIDNQGLITEASNFGGKVDILAPGEFIVSTFPIQAESRRLRITGYDSRNGTSYAAPFVTAVAASLKLVNPDISLDHLKAKMFSSAQSEVEGETKFSKYGLVNMKGTINNDLSPFLSPNFKNTLDVTFEALTNKFSFELPIKNYVGNVSNIEVELSLASQSIRLDKSHYKIPTLSEGESRSLVITGQILKLTADNRAELSVKIKAQGFSSENKTALYFSRNASKDIANLSLPIIGNNDYALTQKTAFGLLERETFFEVNDKYNQSKNPEYFYLDPKKQKDDKTVISLIRRESQQMVVSDFEIKKILDYKGIYRVDINLDGKLDYLIYGIDTNDSDFVLSFVGNDLKPLFGDNKSHWKFKSSFFFEKGVSVDDVALPIGDHRREEFVWIKKKTEQFGEILVPAFSRVWYLPSADNSKSFFDELPEKVKMNRFYYLNPIVEGEEVEVEVRTLGSFDFLEKFKEQFNLNFAKDLYTFKALFNQSLEESQQGQVKALISVGNEFDQKYFLINYDHVNSWQGKLLEGVSSFAHLSHVFPVLSLENQLKETNEVNLFRPTGDITARISRANSEQGEFVVKHLENPSWGEKILRHAVSFSGEGSPTFVESRYNIISLLNDGKTSRLNLNRESSFPRLSFTETYFPIAVSDNDGSFKAGLSIDSTLIFGNRIYSMVQADEGFIRPMSLSLNIPDSCLLLKPTQVGEQGKFHYTMLCDNAVGQKELRFIPISLD